MLSTHTRSVLGTALALTLTLIACSPTNDTITTVTIDSVTIDGGDRTILLGTPLTLTATITTTGNADDTITWTSSDVDVATIDATGTVTTLTTGTTLITATSTTDPTKHDTITLTITETNAVLSVTIDGGDRSLALGRALTLTASVEITGSTDDGVTWTSSDEAVATIDAAGTVTSLTAGTTLITATSTTDPTMNDSITLTVDPPGVLVWTRQFGTSNSDLAYGIATDTTGNVYTTGWTEGALEGDNAGNADVFIRSYDSDGNTRWTHQFGTDDLDAANGIATDTNGNVYVTGYTLGALAGDNAGDFDAFIRSYDGDGNLRWTHQFGTTAIDFATSVATDVNGNVYVAGSTSGDLEGTNAGSDDVFIRSYDSDGTLRWTRQFGTDTSDFANGVAIDANGNVYVTGRTFGALAGPITGTVDAFVRSYDSNGDLRWTRQFGTDDLDVTNGIATDTNANVYVVGRTGALAGPDAGSPNAFIRSYDSDGNLRWTHPFGTGSFDDAAGVATDVHGNVYASGSTEGALAGDNAGGADAFIRSYDSDGNLRWTRQFGTSSEDVAVGVATDTNGNVYTTGYTSGALVGENAGDHDAFIRKYGP